MIVGSEVFDDGTLAVSYYNEAGKIEFIKKRLFDHEQFNWTESTSATSTLNWDGRFVKKTQSEGRYITPFRIQELLREKFNKDELDIIYNTENSPKKAYLDIEIKLTDDGFPDPDKARMPVGLISFCTEDNVVYVLSLLTSEQWPDGLTPEDVEKMEKATNDYVKSIKPIDEKDVNLLSQTFKIKYRFFKEEEELMSFFFHHIMPKLSFITGWNVTGFDWKYLMNRSRNLKIDPLQAAPSKTVSTRNQIPTHLGILDYMEVFDTLKPYKVVENNKLDYVANLVLGANKLKHSYSSFMEFQKDTYLFTLYNIVDVILVKMIEDKLTLLEVAFSIANIAQIEVNKVFNRVYIAEILMCREFLNRGRKMMKVPWNTSRDDKSTYVGAYVSKPIPGHYRYVSCYDFSSMYPNVQIQFNISPDTYLGKRGHIRLKGNEIHTKNDTFFRSDVDSVSRAILTRLYDERIDTQKEIAALRAGK